MEAAGLKGIDTVVSSTAVLIKSKTPSNPQLIDLIASRIQGVISKSLFFQSDLVLTPLSRPKVCPMPVQCPTDEPRHCIEYYSWKASANGHCFGRRRLGCSEFDGREKEHCNSNG
jgi:hypothetical protein